MTTNVDGLLRVANLVHTDEVGSGNTRSSDHSSGANEPGTRSSAGEHALHTGGVVGSIPTASTILPGQSPGWIYFIEGERTGFFKIGLAADPAQRLRGLQGSSPDRLIVRLVYHVDAVGRGERDLHRKFREWRAHGEWFKPSRLIELWVISEPGCEAARQRAQQAADAVFYRRDATNPTRKRRASGARATV